VCINVLHSGRKKKLLAIPTIAILEDKQSNHRHDEAKPGQILISARVLMKVENAVKVEPASEFELKGIARPLAAYNVIAVSPSKV